MPSYIVKRDHVYSVFSTTTMSTITGWYVSLGMLAKAWPNPVTSLLASMPDEDVAYLLAATTVAEADYWFDPNFDRMRLDPAAKPTERYVRIQVRSADTLWLKVPADWSYGTANTYALFDRVAEVFADSIRNNADSLDITVIEDETPPSDVAVDLDLTDEED